MSKFTLSAAVFAATLAAVQEGTTVQKHAAQLVSFGLVDDVQTFVHAFEVMTETNALDVSVAAVKTYLEKVKPSKSAPLLKLCKAIASHNETYPLTPLALSVGSDGSYNVSTQGKARKARGTGTSRKSSYEIARACAEKDGYTIGRVSAIKENGKMGFQYSIDGVRRDGQLGKCLYSFCADDSATVQELTRWNYKR